MKSFFLIGTIFLITSVAFSQNTNGYEKSNTTIAIDSTITVKSNTTITIGLNIIDNNNHVGGSGIVPFIGGKLDFKHRFL